MCELVGSPEAGGPDQEIVAQRKIIIDPQNIGDERRDCLKQSA